jgi:hypothetical protein
LRWSTSTRCKRGTEVSGEYIHFDADACGEEFFAELRAERLVTRHNKLVWLNKVEGVPAAAARLPVSSSDLTRAEEPTRALYPG